MTIALYFLTLLSLAVYSYSQIDLNLTLFRAPWFLAFQNLMIQLGYYYRPLSAAIFVVLLALLYILKPKNILVAIGGICLLSVVSYPFLSHDIFNYIFDARIVTTYGQNPYFLKALDFPADPWVRFMNWTHRPYPYGPVWLLTTLIPSFLGFGKFILTLFNFKLLFAACYLANCWLVKKINPKNLAFFALSPLIIIETLYSPHNEAPMLTFLLLSVLFFKNKVFSTLSLFFSGGVKFLTWVLLPFGFLVKDRARFIKAALVLTVAGLIPVVLQREIYPWYLVTVIGLAALLPYHKKFHLALTIFSFFVLLRYVPYLYVGSYPLEVTLAQNALTLIGLFLAGLIFLPIRWPRLFGS